MQNESTTKTPQQRYYPNRTWDAMRAALEFNPGTPCSHPTFTRVPSAAWGNPEGPTDQATCLTCGRTIPDPANTDEAPF